MIQAPPLLPGTVHVWTGPIDLPESVVEELEKCLSDTEKARAGRFRLLRDRRRSVAGRALLRRVLAAYTGADPAALLLSRTPRGKPVLASPSCGLAFNLSHSGPTAAVAVTRQPRVGVDIEQVRPVPGAARIAARYFSPRERETLESAPPEARPAVFLRAWTAKEAFVKAAGAGFYSELNRVPLPVIGESEPRCAVIDEPGGVSRTWTFLPFRGDGWIGTVAVEGECVRLELFEA